MKRQMRLRAVRHKEIDQEKLALAFLMLAKLQNDAELAHSDEAPAKPERGDSREAA